MPNTTPSTPWHEIMSTLAEQGRFLDVDFGQRPYLTPAALLHEWIRPHTRGPEFLQRQGARMMLIGLFDYLCHTSAQARQAALDLGFKPVFEQVQGEADHV